MASVVLIILQKMYNHHNEKAYKELKTAMLIVWAVISIITTSIILFPLFADKQTVLVNAPTCISKSQFNIECSLCGMTRAFIEISTGNLREANRLNHVSLIVYMSFILNSIIFLSYISYSTIHRKRV